MAFKPMLAATFDPKWPLRFPAYGSPKLDGIRLIILDGQPMTRSLKRPIRNTKIANALQGIPALDGEILVGDYHDDMACATTQSGVMSSENPDLEDKWTYYVFDHADPEKSHWSFEDRYSLIQDAVPELIMKRPELEGHIRVLQHSAILTEEELWAYEESCISLGYEGIMLRDPQGNYKWGRSTAKEGGLIKVKRWEDAEGVITAVYAEEHNANEAKINPLGKTERSSHKANKVEKDSVGSYTIRTFRDENGFFGLDKEADGEPVEFDLGAAANMTADERKDLFLVKESLVGRVVTFRYQWTLGAMRPRFPTFKCFRLD